MIKFFFAVSYAGHTHEMSRGIIILCIHRVFLYSRHSADMADIGPIWGPGSGPWAHRGPGSGSPGPYRADRADRADIGPIKPI